MTQKPMATSNKNGRFFWPDARGWIGIGVFVMSIYLLWMLKVDEELRESEFYKTIATVIITQGWMSVVSWAFAVTKGGGELADQNAAIVAESATATAARAVKEDAKPREVEIVQPPEKPVPVTDLTGDKAAPTEELPEYARG